MEAIYKTDIVAINRILEVTFGGAILESSYGSKVKEVVCFLPADITKEIKNGWKEYRFYINNKGIIIKEKKFNGK